MPITLQDELDRLKVSGVPHPAFVNISGGAGSGGIGLGGTPPIFGGGPSTGYNPLPGIGISAGSGGSSSPSLSSSIGSSILSQLFGGAGDWLLRLVFLILGLLCVAGAIYLFKDTRFIVQPLVDGAKETAKAVGASAVA